MNLLRLFVLEAKDWIEALLGGHTRHYRNQLAPHLLPIPSRGIGTSTLGRVSRNYHLPWQDQHRAEVLSVEGLQTPCDTSELDLSRQADVGSFMLSNCVLNYSGTRP